MLSKMQNTVQQKLLFNSWTDQVSAYHHKTWIQMFIFSIDLANRGVSSGSSVKELKEKYFDKKKIQFIKDRHFKTCSLDGSGYQCRLSIDGKTFTSRKCQSKSDAENGAAKQALKHFNLA